MADPFSVATGCLGIASVAAALAQSLYEQTDTIMHAQDQIARLAANVGQFSQVLRQLESVLKENDKNCFMKLLDDIDQITSSCHSTFKEIDAALGSKSSSRFIGLKWLFRKAKAKELEQRLESEKSTLQTMILVLTLSRQGETQPK